MRDKRSIGIALLGAFFGVTSIYVGGYLMLSLLFIERPWETLSAIWPWDYSPIAYNFWSGVAFVLGGTATAIGLLQMRAWALRLTVCMSVFLTAIAIANLLKRNLLVGTVGLVLSGLMAWYMFRPETKQAFKL